MKYKECTKIKNKTRLVSKGIIKDLLRWKSWLPQNFLTEKKKFKDLIQESKRRYYNYYVFNNIEEI